MTAHNETSGGEQRSTIELLQEFSIPLVIGVVLAVIWANMDAEGYAHFFHLSPFGDDSHFNLHFLINDLFMVLFFGIAAKEITESCLPGGALNPPAKAVNPLLGTLGGVFGPVAVYFMYIGIFQPEVDISNGWGIPTATDIALAWLIARLCFGANHPAVSFLLLLAVADDAIGLGIIAVFYPTNPPEPAFLLLVLLGMGASYGMRKRGVTSYWPYLLIGGTLSWCGLYFAHLHPALALVVIVPFMPSSGHDEGLFAEEANHAHHHDTLNRFEHEFKVFVDFGLFGFGLSNAGVAFSSMGHATWAVLASLVVGKTAGIFLFSMVGHALGFKLPEGMNARSLFVAGFIAGLGLTVALFVAGVAFAGGDGTSNLEGAAKMGALFSAVVAPVALFLAWILKVKEPASEASPSE